MAAPVVGLVSPGNMGAAVGARLHTHGVRVVTPSGRSAESEARARAAGIEIVDEHELGQTDFLFSIVPPNLAIPLAERLAKVIGSDSRRPLYIDWNAVSPERAKDIADIIEAAGGRFADGSIIGLPPAAEGPGPQLYASGPEAAALDALEGRGVRFKVMDGPIGVASALKMAYAGITKGTIALGAAMLLAARRAGADEALIEELATSQAHMLNGFRRSIPDMFGKAERWVPELKEIAHFIGHGRTESAIYDSIADFYAALATDAKVSHVDIDALTTVLEHAKKT